MAILALAAAGIDLYVRPWVRKPGRNCPRPPGRGTRSGERSIQVVGITHPALLPGPRAGRAGKPPCQPGAREPHAQRARSPARPLRPPASRAAPESLATARFPACRARYSPSIWVPAECTEVSHGPSNEPTDPVCRRREEIQNPDLTLVSPPATEQEVEPLLAHAGRWPTARPERIPQRTVPVR